MRYVLNRLRLFIKRTPFLYRIAKHLRDERAEELLCNRNSDLCLEGYSSSGNSFTYNLLLRLNPSIRIGHHCHSVANIKLALAYGVPAVFLVRHPESAVSSRVVRFGVDVGQALIEYVDFYEYVRKNADRIIVVRFEDIVNDTAGSVCRIAEASRIEFNLDDLEAKKTEALAYLDEWSRKRGIPERASLPRDEREKKKAFIRDRLHTSSHYRRAEQLWKEVSDGCE